MCVCAFHNQCKHAMELERIGIGTKRMGILLCTSLKSTISDWIGAGTGLVAFQSTESVLYMQESYLCVCVMMSLCVCVVECICNVVIVAGGWNLVEARPDCECCLFV